MSGRPPTVEKDRPTPTITITLITTIIIIITTANLITSASGPKRALLGQNLVQHHHYNHGDQGVCYLGRIWYSTITTTMGTKVCVTWAESGTATSPSFSSPPAAAACVPPPRPPGCWRSPPAVSPGPPPGSRPARCNIHHTIVTIFTTSQHGLHQHITIRTALQPRQPPPHYHPHCTSPPPTTTFAQRTP